MCCYFNLCKLWIEIFSRNSWIIESTIHCCLSHLLHGHVFQFDCFNFLIRWIILSITVQLLLLFCSITKLYCVKSLLFRQRIQVSSTLMERITHLRGFHCFPISHLKMWVSLLSKIPPSRLSMILTDLCDNVWGS